MCVWSEFEKNLVERMQVSELMRLKRREDPPREVIAPRRQSLRSCERATQPVRHGEPYGASLTRTNDEVSPITGSVLFLKGITASGDLAPGDRNFRNIELPNEPKFFDDGRTITGKVFWLMGPCVSHHLRHEAIGPSLAWTTKVTRGQGKGWSVE